MNYRTLLPAVNYLAVRERLEVGYKKPTEEEIQRFLSYWNETYQIWRESFPEKFDLEKLDQKIKLRKLLNNVKL